jgi:hypothetical protein
MYVVVARKERLAPQHLGEDTADGPDDEEEEERRRGSREEGAEKTQQKNTQ